MQPTVASKTAAAEAMQPDMDLARALLGGTRAMRAAGKAHLPKWPNEEEAAYQCRVDTAVLFPAYQRTVQTLTGKPFSKPLTLGDDVPPQLVDWAQDIDLQGRNLDTFAADLMESALGYGICGVLVEFPTKPEGVKTKADERVAGLRPYLIHIHQSQVLGWRAARRNGAWALDQLRIMECVEALEGDYGTKEVEQVRVLEPGRWATFRQNDKKEWLLFEEGVTTLGYIPYVPVYGQRTGYMTGKPPLIEVAHLNVAHWQSASDQQTILHVARVPILTVIGVDDDKWSMTVGASSAVKLPLGGDMKFVEHSGAAINAGAVDLDKIEERMRQAGAELLVLAPGKVTATQVNTENAVGMCALQRITQGLEDAIDQGLQIMAEWVGLPEGGHVTLYNDFGASTLTDASAQLVLALQQGGLITKETAIREQQRRGMLSIDIDPMDELAAVNGEGPALGMMGIELMTGNGVSADTVPVDAPAGPVASLTPTPDLTPVVEAIRLLAESFRPVDLSPLLDALRNQAETTTIEMDVTPIAVAVADAIRSLPAVNIPAQPAHTFNIDATTTVSPAGAPVVNMPAITVNTPDINVAPAAITVNTPDVNVAAPSITVTTPDVIVNQAPITVTTPDIAVAAPTINVAAPAPAPEADKPRNIQFQTNSAGEITGASMI